jgi:catalase (peroxidase I)
MGGYAMADDKGAALASRSRSAPRVVAPRNKVNVALPFGRITVDQPVKMAVGDWISLAGLVVTAVGFSVVIWQLIRGTKASEAD